MKVRVPRYWWIPEAASSMFGRIGSAGREFKLI